MEKTMETTMEIMTNIIKKLAWKFGNLHCESKEDLEQFLWLEAIEFVNKNYDNDYTKVHYGLLKKHLAFRCLDKYRHTKRRDQSTVHFDYSNFDCETDLGELSGSDISRTSKVRFKIGEDEIMKSEVIEAFQKGSPERLFVEIKLYQAGELPDRYYEEVANIDFNSITKEVDVYKVVGINNSSDKMSSKSIAAKYRMYEKIGQVLGIIPRNEDHENCNWEDFSVDRINELIKSKRNHKLTEKEVRNDLMVKYSGRNLKKLIDAGRVYVDEEGYVRVK